MFSAGCFDFIDVMAFCNYYSTCTDRFLSSCLLRFMVCLLIAIYSFLDQSSCYVYLIAFVSFAYSYGECTYFFGCSSCSCVWSVLSMTMSLSTLFCVAGFTKLSAFISSSLFASIIKGLLFFWKRLTRELETTKRLRLMQAFSHIVYFNKFKSVVTWIPTCTDLELIWCWAEAHQLATIKAPPTTTDSMAQLEVAMVKATVREKQMAVVSVW